MKKKSREKDAYYEKWKTPVGNARWLFLSGVLQTAGHTHFFFAIYDGEKNSRKKKQDIHVLTIGRAWPYRLIEEGYASCIGRYLYPDSSRDKDVPDRDFASFCTWKLWGTSFIQELDLKKGLSIYMGRSRKKIVSYLVQTQDEWIEFVSGPPHWQLLKNVTIQAAIQRYLKEGYSS